MAPAFSLVRRRSRASSAARDVRGFTLLELLVAIVIAAVLAGIVSLSVGGADRSLRFEAERVAQLLVLAREEAQLRGAPIRFEADEERYRFLIWRDRRWQLLLDDHDLRERTWNERTQLRVERPDGRREIEFGRDQVDVPFVVRLSRDQATATIDANGLGLFEVR